ncbi:MAG: peptidylprolyl isomerase [Acetobacteraceae bacterium]
MSVSVNGRAVDTAGFASAELAVVHELLCRRAVALGILGTEREDEAGVPAAIERLLGAEVPVPEPTEEECHRYYDAHPAEFRSGELVFVRHILFQVTPGVPVNHLRAKAERTLEELLRAPDDFAARAAELSNCPSGVFGGNIGQLGRGDTVPEFEAAIFAGGTLGILRELVKTRYGFHVVAIDHRIPGEMVPFETARPKIAEQLTEQVTERALKEYVSLLAGEAEIIGVDLNAAATPLVQ